MILLSYPDVGGRGGSRNPGFSRTSFVNGPIEVVSDWKDENTYRFKKSVEDTKTQIFCVLTIQHAAFNQNRHTKLVYQTDCKNCVEIKCQNTVNKF